MSSSTLNSGTVKFSPPEPTTSFVFPMSSARAKSSTFKQPDVVFPYVWTVANITHKISSTPSNTSTTEKLQTDFFTIPGDESQWYFDLLPQGLEATGSKKFKGHVVVVLCSKEKFHGKVALECFVKKHSGRPNTYIKTLVTAGAAKAKKVYPHANCVAAAGVAHSDLKNPAKLLLKDDQVELYLKITITGEERTVTKIAPLNSMSENDGMNELCGKMVEIWKRQELTDVSVKCGGEVFRCHKLVLAARSPVFKARFETSVKDVGEKVIDIDELEVETVKEMINYMYTGTVKDLKFKASGLLEAADRFNLPGLKAIAEQNIIFNMELHRALDIFLLADRHNAEDLRSAAKEMIVKNCSVVVQQEGWKEKLQNHTSLILEIFEAMAQSA